MNSSDVIRVEPDGSLKAIYDDDQPLLALEGSRTISRAGFVEPTLHTRWQIDTRPSGGSILGETDNRIDALQMEINDVNSRLGE